MPAKKVYSYVIRFLSNHADSEGDSEVKDRDVDEIENKPNRARLLYHYPTRSRVIRSLIDYGYEIESIDPNVKTSIFNKKVLTTPGV